MEISECRALEITEDGTGLVEIPSDGRESLDWNWVERGGGFKAICQRLRKRDWIVFHRYDDVSPRFLVVRFK
jgi:hypothetical protein